MGTEANKCVSFVASVLPPGDTAIFLGKRQDFARRTDGQRTPMVGEESMADDFGLLLKAIVLESPSGLKVVAVSAERMAHERQVESPALLSLPNVGKLVHEKTLPMKRLAREIFRPQVGMGMKMDVAHRSHRHALGLERPPLAPHHPHATVVDRIAEDRSGERDLAGGQRP